MPLLHTPEVAGGAAAVVACWAVLHWGVCLPDWLHLGARGADPTLGGAAGPLLLAASVYGTLRLPRRFRRAAVVALVLLASALALAELWSRGASNHDAVAGLLPISDARDYVFEAGRLLDGRTLSSWGSRRPLASAWLAEMLWLTGGNLQGAVAALGFITSLPLALLVLQMERRLGAAAAAVGFFVLFMFYRRFLGTTLSENGGFTFGTLGLALLVEAFAARRPGLLALGVFSLTVALDLRPGAFFVPPCLVLAGAWLWRGDRRAMLRSAAAAALCLVLGLAIGAGVFRLLASSQGMMFANLAQPIYGTINGGDWELIHKQHPEIFRLPEDYAKHPERYEVPEKAQSMAILRLVRAELARDPTLAVRGAARAWLAFVLNRGGPFVYIRNWGLEKLMMILGAAGVIGALWGLRRRGVSCLVISGAAGIALSLPFAPPWDSDSMRVYAATIPFFALFSAAGASLLARLASRSLRKDLIVGAVADGQASGGQGLIVAAAWLFGACLCLFPLYARYGRHPDETVSLHRFEDHAELTMRYQPGNAVRLEADPAGRSYLPRVREADFVAGLAEFARIYPDEGAYFLRLANFRPSFVNPGGLSVVFVAARTGDVPFHGILRLKGHVFTFADNSSFFVEDGLPEPASAVAEKGWKATATP